MIISGLHMIGIKIFNNIHYTIFKKSTYVNNHNNPFIIGYLSSFLPWCGPLQTIQLYALLSDSFIMG